MSKKVLITGANSYIGTSVEKWLKRWLNEYKVDTVDMVDGSWRQRSFLEYDVILHVAGIAHVDVGQVSEEQKNFYYKINTELAIETARKAKEDGVKQFIFMSSMIVYGDSAPIGKMKIITKDTIPSPGNFYGDSKLQAEKGILSLKDETFKVVVLRPPMVYGKGCKGNYNRLANLAKKIPVFPKIDNLRSMIYIDNLCEFIRKIIDKEDRGIFYPQNRELVNTTEMIKVIAEVHGNKVRIIKGLKPGIILLAKFPGRLGNLARKAFGSNYYDLNMSKYREDYQVCDFYESICQSESE